MLEWMGTAAGRRVLLWGGGVVTAAIWALVIFGTPAVVRRLPPDCFSNPERLAPRGRDRRPWLLYAILVAARNLAGVALIILGTVFLQGVLVVMLGLAIMDIPGKAAAVRWLATIPFVWRLMARIRARAGLPPLERPSANTGA
jgi:hypothetical protein